MAGTSAWPCQNSCLKQQSSRVPVVCAPQRSFLAQPSYVRRSRQIREVRARDALDAIASVVPGAIPRPVAKGLVIFFGASFVWSLISKLLSFTLFLGVVGGGGYLYLKSKTGGGGSSSNNDDDDDGALASARRIMDKYK